MKKKIFSKKERLNKHERHEEKITKFYEKMYEKYIKNNKRPHVVKDYTDWVKYQILMEKII